MEVLLTTVFLPSLCVPWLSTSYFAGLIANVMSVLPFLMPCLFPTFPFAPYKYGIYIVDH